MKQLALLRKLKALYIAGAGTDRDIMLVLCEAIRGMPNLGTLSLNRNPRIGCVMDSVLQTLRPLEKLRFLYLNDTGMQSESFETLATVLADLPNLEVLSLGEKSVDDETAKFVFDKLGNLSRLRELYLSDLGIGSSAGLDWRGRSPSWHPWKFCTSTETTLATKQWHCWSKSAINEEITDT